MLALALVQQGDLAGAHRAVNAAIVLQSRLGDGTGLAGAINAAAEVAAGDGRLERAMVLDGAADARFTAMGAQVPSLHRASRDRWLGSARRQLGARARPLLEQGTKLTDEQTIAFVISDADRPGPSRDEGIVEALSEREQEVAQLIASGLTNREIAARIGVAVRTVDAHSEHIRNKLGVRSRTAIVAWVIEHRQRTEPKVAN
jgi:non-specific serine/threonine protein kinase